MLKYWWYRLRWHLAPYFPTKFPLHIDLELTDTCNLACTMCPHGIGEGMPEGGMMDTEVARQIIDAAAAHGAVSLKLNYRGEPTLYKGLANLVMYAKYREFLEVMINTNGHGITFNKALALVGAGLDRVIISLDGVTEETYRAIRVGGSLHKAERAVHYLAIARGMGKKPKIRLQFTAQEANKLEIEDFKAKWAGLVDEIVIQEVADRGQGEGKKGRQRKRCPQPWQRLVVARDGTVFGCCSNWHNEFPVGLINQGLDKVWQGEKLRALRKLSRAREGHMDSFPCNKCTVRASYK